jgi:RTX calcium-binding nonapeptide repeat (4 copies)
MMHRWRALLAAAVGAAMLLAPAATMGGKPAPKSPQCSLSLGVTLASMKMKNATAWVITGTSGSDTINCSGSTSLAGVTIFTRGGSDTVYGTPIADTINDESVAGDFTYVNGNGGNDLIRGGTGTNPAFSTETFEGGLGDDQLIAYGGNVTAFGNEGNDSIDLSQAWEGQAHGGAGNDTIHGPQAACPPEVSGCGNPLFGESGNDTITGGAGRDDLEGGTGTDQLYAMGGDDILIDSGEGAETFDCGDGSDVLQDLDGNGIGSNGTGYLNQPEDDTHVGCDTVLVAVPTCSYSAGTTGCVVLTNVAITDSPSTATYLISGTITFTPTCNPLVAPCSYAYPNVQLSGSGTFSVSGSQTAAGTWTIPSPPNDRPDLNAPYSFTDGSLTPTTCAAAAIRTMQVQFPLLASGGATGGGYLYIRTDDVGTTSRVRGDFFLASLPAGAFLNPVDSQAGTTILC